MSMLSKLRTSFVVLALGGALTAQVPEGYHPMTLWPYGNGERVGVYGKLFKKGDYQRCEMRGFSVGNYIQAKRRSTDSWVEFRYVDGSSHKVLYEFTEPQGVRFEDDPPSDYFGSWHADFVAKQELVGYRIFFQHKFFAEQFIQPDPNGLCVRVWEPAPGRVAWDVHGKTGPSEAWVYFTRDYAENWWILSVNKDGDRQFKDFNLKDAKHPLLIRVEAIQDFRRFVAYYQLGKGYVSGPEEIGAPNGRR
jgi:hypothetical protein